MENKKFFLSIAGNIGSGKSSLTRMISEEFGWTPFYESVQDNPYLSDFYENMNRWSFNLQVYFLSHRFKIHKEILDLDTSVVQDRSIYEDVEIFARNLNEMDRMDDRDYENYSNLFYEMTTYLKPPDLLVYLKAEIPTLMNQIKIRGRDFEKSIEQNYLEKLNQSYNDWIEKYNYGNKITIETDELDFVNNEKHRDEIIHKIKTSLNEF